MHVYDLMLNPHNTLATEVCLFSKSDQGFIWYFLWEIYLSYPVTLFTPVIYSIGVKYCSRCNSSFIHVQEMWEIVTPIYWKRASLCLVKCNTTNHNRLWCELEDFTSWWTSLPTPHHPIDIEILSPPHINKNNKLFTLWLAPNLTLGVIHGGSLAWLPVHSNGRQ